jgi:hypothetical protein
MGKKAKKPTKKSPAEASDFMFTIESDDEVAASESDASDDEAANNGGGGGISFTFDDVSSSAQIANHIARSFTPG